MRRCAKCNNWVRDSILVCDSCWGFPKKNVLRRGGPINKISWAIIWIGLALFVIYQFVK